ncbi:DNA glycosylase, partial [Clavulina sp. PMI_390]
MPSTRSAARNASIPSPPVEPPAPTKTRKRKTTTEASQQATVTDILPKVKRAKTSNKAKSATAIPIAEDDHVPLAPRVPIILAPDAQFIPAQLSFSFADARSHLIKVDNRFAEMFESVKCKPFEVLEPLDPFKTLVVSILGQQISWLAARSITHKFLRLYDSSLPLTPPEVSAEPIQFFPTPKDVRDSSIEVLRTAGLSQRKAEYVKDIAARFADGRLSAAKLAQWTEDEIAENLIAVRGIGPWTVHMFSMFSLRQPDILGVGDLGLQKGLLRWVISSHTGTSAKAGISISAKKLKKQPQTAAAVVAPGASVPPTPAVAEDASTLPPIPDVLNADSAATPLRDITKPEAQSLVADRPIELPPTLTLTVLKARLNGSKVKGQYLTPEEMYFLTRAWRPYRSLGEFSGLTARSLQLFIRIPPSMINQDVTIYGPSLRESRFQVGFAPLRL